jgi:riboflavin kinase/FMN adenylyltransferase
VFRLTPLPLKTRLAAVLGASFVLSLNFDKALSMLEPQEFIQQYVVEKIKAAHVVTGYDFHFGRGRKGNPSILKELGQQLGFEVTVVDQVADEGDSHSPSPQFNRSASPWPHGCRRRELGYYWTVMGEVVRGDHRGRAIGLQRQTSFWKTGRTHSRHLCGSGARWRGEKFKGLGRGRIFWRSPDV